MKKIDVFSARDLRNNASNLIKDAEKGALSLITKHGHPMILAIPFNQQLVELGVNKSMALHLYSHKLLTLAKAAKVAEVSISDFLEILKGTSINVVDYPADEIEADLENIL